MGPLEKKETYIRSRLKIRVPIWKENDGKD